MNTQAKQAMLRCLAQQPFCQLCDRCMSTWSHQAVRPCCMTACQCYVMS